MPLPDAFIRTLERSKNGIQVRMTALSGGQGVETVVYTELGGLFHDKGLKTCYRKSNNPVAPSPNPSAKRFFAFVTWFFFK